MASYEPTYHKTRVYQSWYRVTKCKCGLPFCRAWSVVNVYTGLRAGNYIGWETALRTAILYNSGVGMVRPDPITRIR